MEFGKSPEHPSSTFFSINLPEQLKSNLESDKKKHGELTLQLTNLQRNISTRNDTEKTKALLDELTILEAIIQQTENSLAITNSQTEQIRLTTTAASHFRIPTNLPILGANSKNSNCYQSLQVVHAKQDVIY